MGWEVHAFMLSIKIFFWLMIEKFCNGQNYFEHRSKNFLTVKLNLNFVVRNFLTKKNWIFIDWIKILSVKIQIFYKFKIFMQQPFFQPIYHKICHQLHTQIHKLWFKSTHNKNPFPIPDTVPYMYLHTKRNWQ